MYFEATVNIKLETETKNGISTKNIKELYLVDAMSVTEAEARVVKLFKDFSQDYEVIGVRKSKIVEVVEKETDGLKLIARYPKKGEPSEEGDDLNNGSGEDSDND